MKFSRGFFALGVGVLGVSSTIFAGEMKGLTVTPSDKYLNIVWTPISEADAGGDFDGYAVQWSLRQDDMKNNKYARKYLSQNSLTVRRSSFDKNTNYYFRVYTYNEEGRKKVLNNGSKILQWRIKSGDVIEKAELEAHDPVITPTVTSTTSSTADFDFGALRVVEYDNFADFAWSRPTGMAKSDYDGFKITLSKSADLKDPIASFKLDKSVFALRIKGLTPETTYYVAGEFYKGTKPFGKGKTETLKTIFAIDRSKYSRKSRNIKKIERKAIYTRSIGDVETSTNSNSTTESTTSSSLSNTSTSIISSSANLKTEKSIKDRIAELKSKITALQREIRILETKLPKSKSAIKSSSIRDRLKKARLRSSKISLRERMRARLKAQRK